MALSRRVRFEILRRDRHTCRYCGAQAPDVALTVDHVVPTTLGGSDDPSNLVTACQPCNSGKASIAPDSPIVADVERDALRWKRAIEMAVEMRTSEREVIDGLVDQFDACWLDWQVNATTEKLPRNLGWRDSVERFLAAGLTLAELDRLVKVTMHNTSLENDKRWRYFCGCAWRAVTDLQETARQILDQEGV